MTLQTGVRRHVGGLFGDQLREQATEFAGEFLAPARAFRPAAKRLTFDRLPQLKAFWGLSMKGIIKRAQVIGAIDGPTATRLYKQHSARGFNASEPYPLPTELPRLIDNSIQVHLRDHGYTVDELARSVHMEPGEFRTEFMRQPELPHL